MNVHAHAQPLHVEHAEFKRCQLGRDAYPLIKSEVGIGPIAIATIWLAFYLIATIHSLAF